MTLEEEKYQSDLINATRLPLIYLVIMIHTHYNDVQLTPESGLANYLHYFITEVITRNFLLAVVPCFFIFSSYYFFFKLGGLEGRSPSAIAWSERYYYSELGKRIKGLLIPFILWGCIFTLGYWGKNYIFGLIGLGQDPAQMEQLSRPFTSLIWESIDAPLWYVRDLMCMMLLSPLFYYWVKYTKWVGLVLLYAYYVSGYSLGVSGLSPTAFFFFGAGAYLALHQISLPQIFWKLRYIALIGTAVLPILATLYFDRTPEGDMLVRLYCPMGVITIVNAISLVMRKSIRIKELFLRYSPMVFFVYAVNELYILNWIKGFYARLPYSDHLIVQLLSFILIPLTTVWVCLLLYRLLARYLPTPLSILCGGRVATSA